MLRLPGCEQMLRQDDSAVPSMCLPEHVTFQQLIAGSPHLLLEEEVHLAKPPLKGSPCKNLPSECVVTPPVHVAEHKDNSENPTHKMECSAENAVEKTPFASVNNGQPPNFRPHAGPTAEGLVYKPYTAPGFMGSGLWRMWTLRANSLDRQLYDFSLCGFHHLIIIKELRSRQFPGGILSSNMPHQSSCNERTQKSEALLQGMKLQASKNTSVQGSTGSSPSGRVQGVGTVQAADGRAALPPFPVTTPCPEGAPQHQETDQLSKVIKVVPHNGISATESAARIFQSIQEGGENNMTLFSLFFCLTTVGKQHETNLSS
ncbi:elf3a [Populus alba x Populus x berolinensis]|nr:elf3a [Populus alba x Populus x berolinensis]